MKEKYIVGHLVQPLVKGQPAFIQIHAGIMRTSEVQHFIEMPGGMTRIITKNTCYILNNNY